MIFPIHIEKTENMKLKLLSVALGLLFCTTAMAQVKGGHNLKLAKLYTSGKYEICLFKAEDLCNDPAAGRESEPYLYAAMCYIKLYESTDPEVAADYKDGMRQAVKYTTKFVRKDTDGELYRQNTDFIDVIKKHLQKEMKTYCSSENYTKASNSARNYEKLAHKPDYLFLYYSGMLKCMANNSVQGEHDMAEARTQLAEQVINNTVKVDPIVKSLIIDGFLKYSMQLVNEKRKKDAEAVITLGKKVFPNDGYISVQYNMIVGKK